MRFKTTVALALMGLIAAPAAAVKPSTWTHETEADFTGAQTTDTLVNNLGEIQLARGAEAMADLSGGKSIVYDIARLADGRTVYAAGPEGELAQFDGEETSSVAQYPGAQVFALEGTDAGLWVGISGAPSKLELRSGEDLAVQRTVELPESVRYVWDVIRVGDRLWVATGTEGQVLVLPAKAGGDEGAEPTVALKSPQSNILCLDADEKGRVYAGTDEEGLVYRISEGEECYKPFVLYDASEPEIGALLVQPDGTVFAGTADAKQARPGRLEDATEEPQGRPSKRQPDQPGEEPEIPNQPPKPEPNAETPSGDQPAEAAASDNQDGGNAESDGGDGEKADSADAAEGAADGDAEAQQAAKPSAEQYDRLRQAIRERLAEARESGSMEMQVGGDEGGSSGSDRARLRSRVRSSSRSRSSGSRDGNAIYRINPDGFVREVFRESVMILRLVRGQNGGLLVATGNEGQLYRVNPGKGEVTILADLEPQQVPALLGVGENGVLLGTANPGRIVRLSESFATEGSLTSPTLDAEQVSLWGNIRLTGRSPESTHVKIQTRSGNVEDPEAGVWTDWSEPRTLDLKTGSSAYLPVDSAPARFFQYRLSLHSDGGHSPTISGLSMKYLMPNLRPTIDSITSAYDNGGGGSRGGSGSSSNGDEPKPQTTLKVEWEAEDDNGDSLAFDLQAKPFGSDAPFVTIAEDIDGDEYEWNTRTTEDGRYVLRLNATDAPDNVPGQVLESSRTSDPVLVDNTPPAIESLTVEATEGGDARLTAKITDDWSPVAEVRYSVDSSGEWQLVLPNDLIYDSTQEGIGVTIDGLDPGEHVVTVRATDGLGNSRYATKTVTIER